MSASCLQDSGGLSSSSHDRQKDRQTEEDLRRRALHSQRAGTRRGEGCAHLDAMQAINSKTWGLQPC